MSYAAIVVAILASWLEFVLLFAPALEYRVRERLPVDSRDFLYVLQSTCQAALHTGNAVAVFRGG